MRGYLTMLEETLLTQQRKDGLPIPRKDLEFIADTLRDLLSLYHASPGSDYHFVIKGIEAFAKLQTYLGE